MKKMFKSVWAIMMMVIGMVFTHGQVPVVSDEGNAAVTSDGSSASRTLSPAEAVQAFSNGNRHARPLAEGDAITVKVYASVGPLIGSQDFQPFAADFLTSAYNGNLSSGEVSMVNYRNITKLDPYYLMGGKTIWFAVVIESGTPFYPTNLTSQIVSSPNNLFGKIEVYNNTNLVYAGTSRGEIMDQNGTKTLVSGGRWSEMAVTKFVFLGTASKTMDAPSQAQMDSNANWMNSFSNFTLEATWGIKVGGVTYSKSLTLETHPFVLDPPTLMITRDNGGIKVSSPDLPSSISADVLASPTWDKVGTITGTSPIILPTSSAGAQLFRLRVVQ